MNRLSLGDQGEVAVFKVDSLPENHNLLSSSDIEKDGLGNIIISHSEKGHHHVIDDDVMLYEADPKTVPEGMKIMYAIFNGDKTRQLSQTAEVSHKPIDLEGDIIEFRIKREYNPFRDEAKAVMD